MNARTRRRLLRRAVRHAIAQVCQVCGAVGDVATYTPAGGPTLRVCRARCAARIGRNLARTADAREPGNDPGRRTLQ